MADISLLNCICHFEAHSYNLHFPHACIVKINLQFFLQTCSICFLIKREHNTSTSICTDRHTDGRKLNHGLFQPLLCMKHEDARSTLIQAMYRQNFNCIGNNIPLETKNIPYKVFIFFIHLICIFGLILF